MASLPHSAPRDDDGDDKYSKAPVSPSRCCSLEMFSFYFVVTCLHFLPLAMFSPIARKTCDEHPQCKGLLRRGWVGDLSLDLADNQWREFRANIPMLIQAAAAFLALSRLARHFLPPARRSVWYCASSAVYIWALSGTGGALVLFGIAGLNFLIGQILGGSRYNPLATWTFGVAVMVINEFRRDWLSLNYLFGEEFRMYDTRGLLGIHMSMYMRMVFLKMVSFNVDYYWAEQGMSGKASSWHMKALEKYSEAERDDIARGGGPYSWREKTARPSSDYNFVAYYAYLFYVPLMLTGPIMPFNAFISYVHKEQTSYSSRDLFLYLLRLLIAFLMLDVGSHFYPVIAICTSGAYEFMYSQPAHLAALVYMTLKSMWLKFLVLWRFFRTWALFDGIEPVENMNRCMSNNWTLEGFWKSWHRSFNRWLVRYIYIPLGGSHYKYITVFVVFTFVALWHDMNMKLLAWGWITGLTFLPEMLIKVMFNRIASLRAMKKKNYFRFLVAFGGALNILLLMVANMVGYSVGLSGTGGIASSITWGNALLVLYVVWVLANGVIFMQEWREEEKRRGIKKDY